MIVNLRNESLYLNAVKIQTLDSAEKTNLKVT